MSRKILRVEYLIDDDSMTDEEYENQEPTELTITEDMIIELIEKKLKPGQFVMEDSLLILTKI